MIGWCRRALSHEPCMFIATSTYTSKNIRPVSPTRTRGHDVAMPTSASDAAAAMPPTSITRRVPRFRTTRPIEMLAARPDTAVRVRNNPIVRVLTPI